MSYIGTEPKDIRSFGRTQFDYTASQGQTAFTGADDDGKVLAFTTGQINVFVNGILMDDSDFTTTGTGTVTLASAANLNDIISIVSFESNIPDNDYVPASGGTFTGNITASGTLGVTGAVTASNGLTVDDDGATPLTVDRATSDGTVIDIQKDGTSVGNIAARVGHLRIGNDDIGLEFHKTNNAIYPANLTAGTLPDNTTDLGASNIRFKDIYTSGGIYLGAASNSTPVAANYLDDYEEGEYTPLLYGYTTGSGTLLPLRSTHNVLSYTKVGRKVTVNGKIETSGSHSATGSLLLSVPFTSANLTDQAGQGAGSCFFYRTGQLHENPTVVFGEGVDYVYFFSNTSGGDVLAITANVMDTAIELIVGFTFFTT